jgi:hypothetical protein
VLLRGNPHAKVHVRLGRHRVGARPDSPDRVALGDHPALVDEQRPELGMRDREAVGRAHRDDKAVARHRAREGDGARRRRPHP